jgi:hypothetical protein
MAELEQKLRLIVDTLHQMDGLALPKDPIETSTVQLLLRSYCPYSGSQRDSLENLRGRVRIIFEAVCWFSQFRDAAWFWDRLKEELQLNAEVTSAHLQQTVKALCDARRAYWREYELSNSELPTISHRASKFLKPIDKVINQEAHSGQKHIYGHDPEYVWAVQAASWANHFERFVRQLGDKKAKQPKKPKKTTRSVVTHEETPLAVPSISQTTISNASQHQPRETTRTLGSPRVSNMVLPAQQAENRRPVLQIPDLTIDLLQHIEGQTREKNGIAPESAPYTEANFLGDDGDFTSPGKSQNGPSFSQKASSYSTDKESYEVNTSRNGSRNHTNDQHVITEPQVERSRKRQASPLPGSNAEKKQRLDARADEDSSQEALTSVVEPVHVQNTEKLHQTTLSNSLRMPTAPGQLVTPTVNNSPSTGKHVTNEVDIQLPSKARPTAPERNLLATGHTDTVATQASLKKLLADYQTKKDADDFKSTLESRLLQLECQSQRLDKLETLVLQEKRSDNRKLAGTVDVQVDDGKQNSLVLSRECQLQTPVTCELATFLQDIGTRIKEIRHQLRAKLRQEDETTEGWQRMSYLGNVMWSLDDAIKFAKHGAIAVQEM